MTTKHKPATPLPHIGVTDANQIWDGSRSMVIGEFQLRQDCGYYAHAANAYPEFVAKARAIVEAWRSVPDDAQVPDEINGGQSEALEALLRELGETE